MTDLIVDGNSLYARAYYAVAYAQRSGSKMARPADAMKACMATALSLIDPLSDRLGERIDRTLFAWDGEGGQGISDKGRDPKPSNYHETREIVMGMLEAVLDTANAVANRCEGDDVVCSAVYKSKADIIFVASGDKDLQQLQGGRVQFFCLNQKSLLTSRAINNKWHIKHPSQLAIALAILGDKTDAISGLYGYGPVKVKKLFEKVTEDMSFEAAFEAILAQLPHSLHLQFTDCLDRTLLHMEVDVPEPRPLQLGDPKLLEDWPDLYGTYMPIYRSYRLREHSRSRMVEDDEEDVPTARG